MSISKIRKSLQKETVHYRFQFINNYQFTNQMIKNSQQYHYMSIAKLQTETLNVRVFFFFIKRVVVLAFVFQIENPPKKKNAKGCVGFLLNNWVNNNNYYT